MTDDTAMTTHALTDSLMPHLLEQMSTAMLCITDTLEIVYANSAAETLFYISQIRLIHSPVTLFFATDINKDEQTSPETATSTNTLNANDFTDLVKRALTYHQGFSLRNVELAPHYLRPKAHHVDIMVTPLSLPNTSDSTSYLLLELTARDRQTRIAHEAQLNQQHAVTRQMIRGVAHEIKNPLAGIRGAAQLLQRSIEQHASEDVSTSADYSEYTSVIINESDRLKELANSMLGSHKLLNLQPTNIHEPLEHVRTLIATQFDKVTIKRDYDSSLPEIAIDADKLIQVFLNISLNAAQALSEYDVEDATLLFKTRIDHNITINTKMHRQCIVISLIDNGPGIPENIQKTLFYPMVSGRAQGTGLGLSIAHDIVQQHSGMLRYTSDVGRTAFQVVLPFTPSNNNTTHNNHERSHS